MCISPYMKKQNSEEVKQLIQPHPMNSSNMDSKITFTLKIIAYILCRLLRTHRTASTTAQCCSIYLEQLRNWIQSPAP